METKITCCAASSVSSTADKVSNQYITNQELAQKINVSFESIRYLAHQIICEFGKENQIVKMISPRKITWDRSIAENIITKVNKILEQNDLKGQGSRFRMSLLRNLIENQMIHLQAKEEKKTRPLHLTPKAREKLQEFIEEIKTQYNHSITL